MRAGRIADAVWFQSLIVAVIVANAVLIGIETYPSIVDRFRGSIDRWNSVFLAIFVAEISVRLAAFGRSPHRFFTKGWNVFDFTIVALSLIPGSGGSLTLLRIVRIMRVIRLIEVMEDLRLIVRGLIRSLAPLAGVALFVMIILYAYAIVGTALFGEQLPDEWGNAGAAMLTCFRILTLDNWDDLYFSAAAVSSWTTAYFVSFIIVATLVVLNIVIAVVVSSVEQARIAELQAEASHMTEENAARAPEIANRILSLRQALDELEQQLTAHPERGDK